MLFNISNKNLKTEKQINDLVGKPFSLIENIKKGGIGSPKLFITRCSAARVKRSRAGCNNQLQ